MSEKINRYSIETYGGWTSKDADVWIKDRKEDSIICDFRTGNKKLNMELAKLCLRRIDND